MASFRKAGMQSLTTSFRKASEDDIHDYICRVGRERHNMFKRMFRKEVKTNLWVTNENTISITDPLKLPVGVIYEKGSNEYAMGVCDTLGTFVIDDVFTVTTKQTVEYEMWGAYQRTGWSVLEIESMLGWRWKLMETPRNIYRNMIPDFERSRWMLFCFWPVDIEELITLEMKLMDDIFEVNMSEGGIMYKRVPEKNGCSSIEEYKELVKKQYRETTFSLNEEEKKFINSQVHFDLIIKSIYKV